MIVDAYLSPAHRDDPGHGCAVPRSAPKSPRESAKTRKAFAAKLEQMIDMVADQIPGLAAQGRAQAGGSASPP